LRNKKRSGVSWETQPSYMPGNTSGEVLLRNLLNDHVSLFAASTMFKVLYSICSEIRIKNPYKDDPSLFCAFICLCYIMSTARVRPSFLYGGWKSFNSEFVFISRILTCFKKNKKKLCTEKLRYLKFILKISLHMICIHHSGMMITRHFACAVGLPYPGPRAPGSALSSRYTL
jgi:hypothetical protein